MNTISRRLPVAPTQSALAKQNQVIASSQTQPTLWHSLEIEQASALLENDQELGLSTAQVKERIDRFGLNELTGKQGKPTWLKFLLQYIAILIRVRYRLTPPRYGEESKTPVPPSLAGKPEL
ncbi:MAG TPA: cation-transporting P-type ATPase [Coleofasciculaceae cyanobacterium]